MNTRARVKAIPAVIAASMGLGVLPRLDAVLAHDGHLHANLQPEGFETIEVTIEESGVVGFPESVEAGRYLIKATGPASEPGGMPSGIMVLQLPEGLTPEQAFEDTQNAESEPEWYQQAHFAGGVFVDTEGSGWSILDLTPGAWVVTTLFGTTMPVALEVTGEFPAEVADPGAGVVLTLAEMTIEVTSGEFVAGENLVEVVNGGAALHFVDLGKVPDGTTNEQVEALFNSFMTGTPDPNALGEDDLQPLVYIPDQSGGTTQFVQISLEPGTYFLSCWVLDHESMMPHAMMGMWTLVTVE